MQEVFEKIKKKIEAECVSARSCGLFTNVITEVKVNEILEEVELEFNSKECKNIDCPYNEEKSSFCPAAAGCAGYEKKQTNGDRIRSMTDEELADMLHNIGSYVENGNPFIDIWIGEDKTTLDDSFGYIKEWLKEESEV